MSNTFFQGGGEKFARGASTPGYGPGCSRNHFHFLTAHDHQ